jgi:transcriptional antiterminator
MSKGYNQSDIAKELHTTRRTVLRDVAELNHWIKIRNGSNIQIIAGV